MSQQEVDCLSLSLTQAVLFYQHIPFDNPFASCFPCHPIIRIIVCLGILVNP